MKRGQCSNNPSKCSNAANNVLLPYAGTNSICPECGAPLALVATESAFSSPSPTPKAESVSRTFEPEYDDEPETNQALEFAKMAILFVIVAGAAFFGLKYFANRNADNSASSNMVIGNEIGNQISPSSMAVVDINPNIIGKTAAISEVRASPSISAQSLGQLAAGVALDINGKVSVDGFEWYRISMPNQSGISGFVRAQEITSLDGVIMGSMTNQVATVPTTPTPPVVGPIVEITEANFYISGDRANIRSEAGVNGARVGETTKGNMVSASASRKVDGKTWYRVTTANGVTGWVSASLLSSTPIAATPSIATDQDPNTATGAPKTSGISSGSNVLFAADAVKVRQAPDASSNVETDETQRGMVVQVDDVQTSGSSVWYHVHSNRFNIDGWVEAKNVKPADN